MAQITKEISVDVARPNYFPAVVAKQYDERSRFLRITLRNEGVSFPASQSDTVAINATRPDGERKDFSGVVNEDGTVTVPLTKWILSIVGIVQCDISLTDEDQVLSTTTFKVEVQKVAYDGEDYQQED